VITISVLPEATKLILESFNWKSINLTTLHPDDIEKLARLFVTILESSSNYDSILLRDWFRLYLQHMSDDVEEEILNIAEQAQLFYKIFHA